MCNAGICVSPTRWPCSTLEAARSILEVKSEGGLSGSAPTYWSFDRKILLDDKAKAQKFILAKIICEMHEMRTFHFEIRSFHLKNSKCTHFTLKCTKYVNVLGISM